MRMVTELLLLIKKKRTDRFNEQRKKPKEKFKYKPNKQIGTFSFSPPINLTEEGKHLSVVTAPFLI